MLVSKNFISVLGMWDKNYFSGESQMAASDFDLHSNQDSKSNKMSQPRGMAENSAIFEGDRHGSPIITPFNSPVHNLQKPKGCCHIECIPQNQFRSISHWSFQARCGISEEQINSFNTQYAVIDV